MQVVLIGDSIACWCAQMRFVMDLKGHFLMKQIQTRFMLKALTRLAMPWKFACKWEHNLYTTQNGLEMNQTAC